MDNAIETLSSTGWLTIPGLVVLGLAGLYLIQGTWSGWKQGFPRKLANLVILSATSWTSWYFRSDIAGFLESRVQVPKLALELASFFYSFLISYLVLLAIAYCIFKKTKDVQGGGMGYGIGGAVLETGVGNRSRRVLHTSFLMPGNRLRENMELHKKTLRKTQ